ncbi:MAG: aminoglycoside phosphotransferase family protein [Acetobacteraceae bacterium]|nr:aminoglycoside phosphotransferase family protein [Acetobacteraceae bacterium]
MPASREGWIRKADWVALSHAEIAALLRPALGQVAIVAAARVSGGLVNTNLQVTLNKPSGRVLLRVFQRDPLQARKEAAIDRLIDGRAPSARFLYFSPSNPITGSPYAVLQWVDGIQLDHATRNADESTRWRLGAAVGEVLARIHSFRFPRFGFFTDDLEVPTAIDLDRDGLLWFMRRCLIEGPGGQRLGAVLTERLFTFVEREGSRLDAWLGEPTLTHADFNPSNILVHRDENGWRVAAVLDWEFALSATPAFDVGNLLRLPFGNWPEFVAGFERGYRAAGGELPGDWRLIAQIADIFAWVDLLGQRSKDAALAADAQRVIAATVEIGG